MKKQAIQAKKKAIQDLKNRDRIGGFTTGRDSKGRLKILFIRKMVELSKKEFLEEAKKITVRFCITGKTNTNDYFWKFNAIYHESVRRGLQTAVQDIYKEMDHKYRKDEK